MSIVCSTYAWARCLVLDPWVQLNSFNLLFTINLEALLKFLHILNTFWLYHALLDFALNVFILQVINPELSISCCFSSLLIYLYLRSNNRVINTCPNALIRLSISFVVISVGFAFFFWSLMHQFNRTSRFRPVNVMETLSALLVHSLLLHHRLGVAMNIDVCVIVIYNYYLSRLSKRIMPTSTCIFIRFKINRAIWILIVVWILLTQNAPVNI